MAFDSSDNSPHSMCYCTSYSQTISTDKSNYDFADCSSNSTYFDLRFNQVTSTPIIFRLCEWYSIIPEPDKHYSFSVPTNKELNVQECRFESTSVTLVEGKMICNSLFIDSKSTIVIEEKASLSVSRIITTEEINNLNQNGTIINFGTLSSIKPSISITTQMSQSKCFELISSSSSISVTVNNGHILEKKLLRVCPPSNINSTIVCTLDTNKINNTNTYQNIEGSIVHCPCYGLNCITKFSKEDTIIIASEYQGIIELIDSTTQIIEQQYKSLTTLRIKGNKNIVTIITNSKTSNQFILSVETGSKILLTGNKIGFYQNNTNKLSTRIGSEYPCQSLLFNGETSKCSICKNTVVNGYCPYDNEIPKHCLKYPSLSECIQCEEDYYLEDKICTTCPSNCLKCLNGVCIQCKDNHYLDNGNCLNKVDPSIKSIINNVVIKCHDSFYSIGNTCSSCSTNCQYCSIKDRNYEESVCSICSNSTVLTSSKECSTIPNSEITSNINVIECENNYRVTDGQCESCNQFGSLCQKCTPNQCTLCLDGIINENGICVDPTTTGCLVNEDIKTSYCMRCKDKDKYYDGTSCVNTNNCLTMRNKALCYECQPGYIYDTLTSQCVDKTKIQTNLIEKCSIWRGEQKDLCLRCKDNYYYDELSQSCIVCNSACLTCSNKDTCFTCTEGYSLINTSCILSSSIIQNCRLLIVGGDKCAVCNSHYYRTNNGLCQKCLEHCNLCYESDKCNSCDGNYFLLENTTGCISFDELTHCKIKTSRGCESCEEGYYVSNQYCSSCNSTTEYCQYCSKNGVCNSCTNEYVLIDDKCINKAMVDHCIEVSNSQCTKCSFWHRPDINKTACNSHIEVWLIIFCVIILLIIIIVIIVLLIYIIKRVLGYRKEEELRKKYCIFDMSRSNIEFHSTDNPDVVINKEVIHFTIDNQNNNDEKVQIPVNQETRELICIGNKGKNTIKVQFSVKEGCDKYEIRTNPQLMTIPKGKALEFEVFIKPLCSCLVEDIIKLFSLDMKKGTTIESNIKIKAETELSTRLDPDELKEEKKIGEGSFGIVYIGEFRGNQVAIKKMKQIDKDEDKMKEFEKEVMMLDKFRSEYIIHFYGAVFIPNKICMITEYAKYGSIQDLINKRTNTEIPNKIRIKFMIDGAKGISYLHSNGIIHRDIKPDNFLVITLDDNIGVNCKLTDFGSSRNINMMMTNMTFTKGIGSPIYMAPEVLKREHYKMESDIYSYSITMLQIITWKEPFPKTEFKFPWKIAEFISTGKRPTIIQEVKEDIKEIIEKTWKQEPKERIRIEEVVKMLERIGME
ncbi:protein serine/threonine kinase, putative [Entamoeba dispar SAW760]|uniref:Protein serine/threonine kinase, putative n=1 Tax=Entamoeba dispar (strain ATCC PRA-260 / SAW760) TaxID=370354 RepID=B0EK62_ENTDS|nr:protein serine/threonine kinase, putative [Entamoeba dispar SAW760]EDR25091.1 protein serine/threonine kinase, putative [Entamoeba dispar SAW760]|eukprot:EDR25091.1 protein serine/threonine kinase, putative [Entamoeba dispar SAW760]